MLCVRTFPLYNFSTLYDNCPNSVCYNIVLEVATIYLSVFYISFLLFLCSHTIQYLRLINRLPNIMPHILIPKFNPLCRPIRILPRQL